MQGWSLASGAADSVSFSIDVKRDAKLDERLGLNAPVVPAVVEETKSESKQREEKASEQPTAVSMSVKVSVMAWPWGCCQTCVQIDSAEHKGCAMSHAFKLPKTHGAASTPDEEDSALAVETAVRCWQISNMRWIHAVPAGFRVWTDCFSVLYLLLRFC